MSNCSNGKLRAKSERDVRPSIKVALGHDLGSGIVKFHSQNMMVAASAMADRKTFGHLS